jgi:hypothetical protein
VPPPNTVASFILDDDNPENSVGLTNGGTLMWLNRFTPAGGEYPFVLAQVDAYINDLVPGTAIEIWVYQDDDGDPGNGATLIGGWSSQVVQTGSWNSYLLGSPPAMSGSGDVLIGIVASHSSGQHPASLDQSSSAGRSWYGGAPGAGGALNLSGTVDSAGLPGNWLVRAYGVRENCASPSDIGWLSVTPLGGSTGAGSQSAVDVIFDSTGMASGTYSGTLCIDSNDPLAPVTAVPVTLTVDSCAATAPAAPVVSGAIQGGNDLFLSWTHDPLNYGYEVHGSPLPYDTPGPGTWQASYGSSQWSHTVAGAIGDGVASYYRVLSLNCNESLSAAANGVGEFEFALVPGGP